MWRGIFTVSWCGRDMKEICCSQISRRTAAMASLKVRTFFVYQAAVLGLIFRCLEMSWDNSAMMEYNASNAGVVRRIALSDHWR